MQDVSHHTQQVLAPSEMVTIGVLYARKGVGNGAFYSAQHDPANLKLCRRGAWNERM